MKVKIELEKTVQVRQYEPLRVMISGEADTNEMPIPELYKELSGKLSSMIRREYDKYDAMMNSDRTVEANSAKASNGFPKLKSAKKTTVKSVEY